MINAACTEVVVANSAAALPAQAPQEPAQTTGEIAGIDFARLLAGNMQIEICDGESPDMLAVLGASIVAPPVATSDVSADQVLSELLVSPTLQTLQLPQAIKIPHECMIQELCRGAMPTELSLIDMFKQQADKAIATPEVTDIPKQVANAVLTQHILAVISYLKPDTQPQIAQLPAQDQPLIPAASDRLKELEIVPSTSDSSTPSVEPRSTVYYIQEVSSLRPQEVILGSEQVCWKYDNATVRADKEMIELDRQLAEPIKLALYRAPDTKEVTEITIQLKPASLGLVKVKMDFTSDVPNVTVIAERFSTNELLQSHKAELTAQLRSGDGADPELSFSWSGSRQQNQHDDERHHNANAVFMGPFMSNDGGDDGVATYSLTELPSSVLYKVDMLI